MVDIGPLHSPKAVTWQSYAPFAEISRGQHSLSPSALLYNRWYSKYVEMMSHNNKFLMNAAHSSVLLDFFGAEWAPNVWGRKPHNRQAWQGVPLSRSEGRAEFNSWLDERGQEFKLHSGTNPTQNKVSMYTHSSGRSSTDQPLIELVKGLVVSNDTLWYPILSE